MSTMKPTLVMKSLSMDQIIDVHEAADRIAAMKHQEDTRYAWPDYHDVSCDMDMENDPASTAVHALDAGASYNPAAVDQDCRVKMCEWCYQVVDYFKFSRETVYITMSYLDRFLATHEGRNVMENRSAYQLTAITCLYMAIKIHEPLELDLALLVELSRKCYTVAQISSMESRILNALEWRMNPPTPIAFVQHMLAFVPAMIDGGTRQSLLDIARYQTELAVFDDSLSTTKASTVAAASILNALEGIDYCYFPSTCRSYFLHGLARDLGMDRQTSGVVESRMTLLSQMGETERLQQLRSAPVTNKSQFFPLRRSDGSRNLSPVCVTSR